MRKFLLWKTNKQSDSDEYPGYVVQYTDFSPSRKTPLTREVRVTNSETQSIVLFRGFKDDNVKQGWELHSKAGSMVADPEADIAKSAVKKIVGRRSNSNHARKSGEADSDQEEENSSEKVVRGKTCQNQVG